MEPAPAPRILPSILEPVWGNSETLEAVHCEPSSGAKTGQHQAELNLNAITPEGAKDIPPETLMILDVGSQTGAPVVDDAATPVYEVHLYKTTKAKTRLRKKVTKTVEPVLASDPMLQPEQPSAIKGIEPLRAEKSCRKDRRTPNRRRAAAAQLRRHERWKRRLHPASW
jgi:hypothetical protein